MNGPSYIPERRISPRARRILADRRMAEADHYEFRWVHVIWFVLGMALVYGLFVSLVVIGTAAS
jgi:hypothetical protein